MRLGIMLPNWIGDLAMATPTLRALRQHFQGAEIIGLVRPYIASVLEGTRWLDRLIPWEHRGWGAIANDMRIAWRLRQERIDTFVLMRHAFTAALVARASGAQRVVGYQRFARTWLLTDALPMPRAHGRLVPISAVDSYLELAYKLGCPPESKQLELATTPADEAAGDAIWKELRLPTGQPIIMLHTGGAYGGAKHWPVSHGAALARRIASELGIHVVINCGPAERGASEEMAKLANHRQVKSLAHLPPRWRTIGASKAVIRRMRLMVSTDSGPRHLAVALGVPTITLFGPTNPTWAENYQPDAPSLRVELPCAPCSKRTCPLLHNRCMRDLSTDMVFEAVQRKLTSVPARNAA